MAVLLHLCRFYAADFQHLVKLDLSHQLVGDDKLASLWELVPSAFRAVEDLNLAGNKMTNASLKVTYTYLYPFLCPC
jgi:hypothetical protein